MSHSSCSSTALLPDLPPGPRTPFLRTPIHSRGSSPHATSDAYHSLLVSQLTPHIQEDLRNHQQCSFDAILKHYLSKVLADPNPDRDTLLRDCLNAVLPICDSIHPLLNEYCGASPERARYGPFVNAFNFALDKLRVLNIKRSGRSQYRLPSDLNIMFCRNAERHMKTIHNDDLHTDIVPDIIITSRVAADRRLGPNLSDKQLLSMAQEQPPTAFSWAEVLSTEEFKATHAFAIPPTNYKHYDVFKWAKTIPHIDDVTAQTPLSGSRVRTTAQREARARGSTSDSGPRQSPQSTTEQGTRPSGIDADLQARGRGPRRHPGSRRSPRPTSQQSTRRSEISAETQAKISNSKAHSKSGRAGRPPPLVQCGIYAADMLSRPTAPAVSHAINLVIFDQIAYLWHYDHEGAIQSSGVDLVQDLPRFLVLLFAFQRFELVDWGFIPEIDPVVVQAHTDPLFSDPYVADNIRVDYDNGHAIVTTYASYERHRLTGRGTRVLPVIASSFEDQTEAVVKLSWIDQSRVPEAELISRARERAKGNVKVVNHLPVIVASKDHGYSTAIIREALGLESIPRVLRSHVAHKLREMETLQSDRDAFLKAFFEIERCHYEVWLLHIHHRDLSLSNLMFKPIDDTPVGVLNDWDLAVDVLVPSLHAGLELTGTLPFIAIDLLRVDGIGGKVAHLYRHDHESLTWILTWVCYCYTDGSYEPGNPLSLWRTDYQTCIVQKMAFLGNPLSMLASLRPWAQLWRPLLEARLVLLQEHPAW
ncbi:hypothetical protein C8Q76DRAFT_468586 [Earliella scabrosa]|nr:hypothetical protein C8Q76DRAFT_468586 [Earliella scabrosa]